MSEAQINIQLKKFLSSALKEFNNKNFTSAIAKLKSALSLDPQNPEILYNLGVASCRVENYIEAIDYFRKVLELKYTSVDILQILRLISFSLIKLQMYEEAILYSERGLDFQPDDLVLLHLTAYAYDVAGKRETAINLYRKILEINPYDISAKNSLAYLYAKANRNIKEAYQLAKDAVAANPQNAAYLDTLGFVLFCMNDFARAKEYLEKAHAIDPKSNDISIHLAMVNKALENHSKHSK
ncbi:MAG: tetratricopeptide repeat protein [Spirochaetes bacterium]|nr:tetratricopeptide repeat protein [Spirochaetota bacterium]